MVDIDFKSQSGTANDMLESDFEDIADFDTKNRLYFCASSFWKIIISIGKIGVLPLPAPSVITWPSGDVVIAWVRSAAT